MAMTDTVVLEKTKTTTTLKKKCKVIMHNDDKTSFECVMDILVEVFKKTPQEAFDIALAIHKAGPNGSKVVGEYSKTIAEAKKDKALKMAKEAGYPDFKVTVKE